MLYGVYKSKSPSASEMTSSLCPPPPQTPRRPTNLGETTQKATANVDVGFLSKALERDFPPQPCIGDHGPAEVTP